MNRIKKSVKVFHNWMQCYASKMLHYAFCSFYTWKITDQTHYQTPEDCYHWCQWDPSNWSKKHISWEGHKICSTSLFETLLFLGKCGDLVALKSAQGWLKADSWFFIAGSASVTDDPYALSTEAVYRSCRIKIAERVGGGSLPWIRTVSTSSQESNVFISSKELRCH